MGAEIVGSVHEGPPVVDVSVVLPVFNESGHLEKEIHRIREALAGSEFTFEIVVVDDGSTDGSGELLRDLEGIRLLRFGTNRGSGSARCLRPSSASCGGGSTGGRVGSLDPMRW